MKTLSAAIIVMAFLLTTAVFAQQGHQRGGQGGGPRMGAPAAQSAPAQPRGNPGMGQGMRQGARQAPPQAQPRQTPPPQAQRQGPPPGRGPGMGARQAPPQAQYRGQAHVRPLPPQANYNRTYRPYGGQSYRPYPGYVPYYSYQPYWPYVPYFGMAYNNGDWLFGGLYGGVSVYYSHQTVDTSTAQEEAQGPAYVGFEVDAVNAEVYVDGAYQGVVEHFTQTPLELSAGEHKIELRLNGDKVASFKIRPGVGQTVRIRAKLLG